MKSASIKTRALIGLAVTLLLMFSLASAAHLRAGSPVQRPIQPNGSTGVAAPVITFDLCVRDDSSSKNIQFNSMTGDYLFSDCAGVTLSGVGRVVKRSCNTTLIHIGATFKVEVQLDNCGKRAKATVTTLSPTRMFLLVDRNTNVGTCPCAV